MGWPISGLLQVGRAEPPHTGDVMELLPPARGAGAACWVGPRLPSHLFILLLFLKFENL
jgi:hypothetical protein